MNIKKELSIGLFASALTFGSMGLAGCATKTVEPKNQDQTEQKGEMASCGAQHKDMDKKGEEKGSDKSCGAEGCGAEGCGAEDGEAKS